MARRGRGWDSPMDVAAYHHAWAPLNAPLIHQVAAFLPSLPGDNAWVHVAGVGSGLELAMLTRRFPHARFVLSDLTRQFIDDIDLGTMLTNPGHPFVLADISAPPVQGISLAISTFVLHLCGDPVGAVRAQRQTLAPGGLLAALYFPPVPWGDGPLTALYEVVNELRGGAPKTNWERDLFDSLREEVAGYPQHVGRKSITTLWEVDDPGVIRAAFETLPHIRAVRHKAGEAFYQEMWARWEANPGLTRTPDGRWTGPATAILLRILNPPGD